MKIKLELDRIPYTEPLLDNLSRLDVRVTVNKDADFYVKLAQEITTEDLLSGKKFIALEKNDGARILKREVLKHSAVVKYVKQYRYSTIEWNNIASVDQRAFTTFLTDKVAKTPLQIYEEDWKKISLGWNFLNYKRMNGLVKLDPTNFSKDRKIDVFFAGKIVYGDADHASGNLISEHRKKCIETLNSEKGLRIFARSGRPLSYQDYHNALLASKIVVSPWGWGEACYRDYEALLAGCILIKPMTSFVDSYCDIFKHESNFWTKADFSDLGDVIHSVLAKYKDREGDREERRAMLIDKIEHLPELINGIFKF